MASTLKLKRKNIAHRGDHDQAPENSLLAFQKAIQSGAGGIELDLRLASDQTVVVCHDSTLLNVSQGKERRHVRSLLPKELAAFHIPTFDSVLHWAGTKQNTPLLFVELKHEPRGHRFLVAQTLACLRKKKKVLPEVWIISFHEPYLKSIRRQMPRIRCGLTLKPEQHQSWSFYASKIRDWQPDLFLLHMSLLQTDLIRKLHEQGVAVGVWGICDSVKEVRRCLRSGVDYLLTDIPQKVTEVLKTWRRA